nr:hypothetical protein [Tanacetum cinerariifolium]
MAKTMEQYMSKTRADYGSGNARPKIDDKYSFELKGQFLKELRDNTFSCSDHEDANEHIEKVLEIFDLFHIRNITQDQVMPRAFSMFLTRAASCWLRNKPFGSITTWEDLKTKYLNKYCLSARTAKWRKSTTFSKNQMKPFTKHRSVLKTLDEVSSTLFNRDVGGASVSVMPLTTYLNLGIGKFVFLIDYIILDMSEDVKVPLILGRPFLSTAHVKIDVFKRKITLRVGDEKIIFKSVKLELKRDQVDYLMPTIAEGEVIDEPIKTRNNESFNEYPSLCDFDQKIHIDCAYNLRFPCMIVVENIDGYQDQDMGDIILGESFCKASCVETKMFDVLITIHNGSDNVTYQMVRSHPRFKHLSNAQCNKIKPLLKVKNKREKDKIRTKPDKKGKRGEAGKIQEHSQWIKREKPKKQKKNGQKRKHGQKLIKF